MDQCPKTVRQWARLQVVVAVDWLVDQEGGQVVGWGFGSELVEALDEWEAREMGHATYEEVGQVG